MAANLKVSPAVNERGSDTTPCPFHSGQNVDLLRRKSPPFRAGKALTGRLTHCEKRSDEAASRWEIASSLRSSS
jgi:hypothetical protein